MGEPDVVKIGGSQFLQRSIQAARHEAKQEILREQRQAAIHDWYEGGVPFLQGDRSYVPAIVQDARFDQNFVTRREILRKARYFSQNNPMVKTILETDQIYTVGARGLHVSPMSSDKEWNRRASVVFAEMCENAGLEEGEDLVSMSHIAHNCERTDGEIFALKTRRPHFESELAMRGSRTVGMRPCLQLIEAHRVETPGGKWNDDPDDIIDGVKVKKVILPDGRQTKVKEGFWVRDSFGMFDSDSSWQMIPPNGLMQIGEAQRVGQLRYISSFYAAINLINSLDDLQILEMKAALDGAEKSTAITNAAGEANAAELIKARDRRLPNSTPPSNDPDFEFKKRADYVRRIVGGRTFYLKQGEKAEQWLNNRPTVTSREYWLYLMSVICSGLGPSILMVFPDFSDNDNGTAIRAQLDIDNQKAIKRGRKWRLFYAQVYQYFMGWAIYNDRRVADPPADWAKVKVHAPRAVNVDVGRNMQATLGALGAGLTTWGDEWGLIGDEWRDKVDQYKEQIDYIKAAGITIMLPGRATEDPEGASGTPEPTPGEPAPGEPKKNPQILPTPAKKKNELETA